MTFTRCLSSNYSYSIRFRSGENSGYTDLATSQTGNTALPTYLIKADQQDESQDSMSFGAADQQPSLATSFTSSFTSGTNTTSSRIRSKRNRDINSSPMSPQKKNYRVTDQTHQSGSQARRRERAKWWILGKAKQGGRVR